MNSLTEFDHQGRKVSAFRPLTEIRYLGRKIPNGNWIVEDEGKTFDMEHEAFMAQYGLSSLAAGIPVGRSVGFGTPDDPRNFENRVSG